MDIFIVAMKFEFLRSQDIQPQNVPERLVWWSIIFSYWLWLIGALYIVGSILGWILVILLIIKRLAQVEDTPISERITIHPVIWLWVVGVLVLQISLVMGHLDFDLDNSMIIKSSIGWAKGWALFALYPLAAALPIRREIIVRAVCLLCTYTLLVTPFILVSPYIHIPQILWVSPLKAVGGPGPEFFNVQIYEIEPVTFAYRYRYFTPWAPACGLLGNMYFMIALEEKDRKFRLAGMFGSLLMCFVCKSRLAQVCIFAIPLFVFIFTRLKKPSSMIALGLFSFFSGLTATPILAALNQFWSNFKSARADSTRVRMSLKNIAFYRWEKEAPIWGHGIVEKGPHLVEYMPIGSHHSWAGLLFVKGIVGALAFAVPLTATFMVLLRRSCSSKYSSAKLPFAMVAILILYTFAENLEILIYLFWPANILIGQGLQEKPLPIEQPA